MKIWKITYSCKNGFTGTLEVPAVNRVMAYEMFENLSKEFDSEVVEAQADLIKLSKEIEYNLEVRAQSQEEVSKFINNLIESGEENLKTKCCKIVDHKIKKVVSKSGKEAVEEEEEE